MSSFRISGHCENNVTNVNVSQCSGDLFQESQVECNSFTADIKFSNGKSSETSEEFCFTPRRKPRKALNYFLDSKKSSNCLQNDSIADSSKLFQPISPVPKTAKIGSTTLLDVNQASSPEAFRTPGIPHLSKENVAVVSFVSESEHSDSSSILEDSLKSDNDQNSKSIFKTPICSSVKKRTIREWLNNVSLNCSLKPNENGSCDRNEVLVESSILEDQNESKPVSMNVLIEPPVDKNNAQDKTADVKKLEAFNIFRTKNSYDDGVEKSNSSENYCPWLFDTFEISRNEFYTKQHEEFNIHDSHKHSNEKINPNSYEKNPNKSMDSEAHYKPSKSLDRSLHEESERNISKRGNHSSSFINSRIYKSDDSCISSADDSDSSFHENLVSNPSKIVDSDDSFDKIRLIKKNRKKNCLNISSDDSEAKDTANDSEDIPHHNELYTPKKRLYFRNPLNNSLDDDAEPLTCKDYSASSKDNSRSIEKRIDKSKGLLDQIYSEVHNTSNSSINDEQNQSDSNDISRDSTQDINLKSVLLNKPLVLDTDLSVTQPAKELNESASSVSDYKSSSIRHLHSSPSEQDDVNQINFSSLSINNTSKKNISESDHDFQINCSKTNNYNDKFPINETLDSSKKLSTIIDDSSDSIVNIKRKSKKNFLNISSDDNSFVSKKPNSNIIDVGEISGSEPISSIKQTSIDLTKSDDEYDKYLYRTRSDSSLSDFEEIPGVSKDSSEVLSVHATTSEEDDDGSSPWFDLESYLKKNIPASSKSLDSSFIKKSEKRVAMLAKISLPTHSSSPHHTSFLLSLTPAVPDEMCHPDAVKYRRESFSKHKTELVDLLFKLYNKEIFDEKLPPLEIKWSGHLTTTSGITKSSSKITKNGKIRNSFIKLSKTVVDDAAKLRDVLLHELCHAANWLIDEKAGGHGPLFKKWVNKIWIKFPEVPKVRTTHHYELKWKYLYKCSYCGYELGKMKLSLNETSCRLCGGLVTVNT